MHIRPSWTEPASQCEERYASNPPTADAKSPVLIHTSQIGPSLSPVFNTRRADGRGMVNSIKIGFPGIAHISPDPLRAASLLCYQLRSEAAVRVPKTQDPYTCKFCIEKLQRVPERGAANSQCRYLPRVGRTRTPRARGLGNRPGVPSVDPGGMTITPIWAGKPIGVGCTAGPLLDCFSARRRG